MAAINPPSWAKNAVPTLTGWRDPRSNELLKSQAIAQEDIDSYMGVTEKKSTRPFKAPREEVKKPVLEDISINMSSGNFLAVVGQVGCGKSSLLLSVM